MIRLGDILDEVHQYNPRADFDLINKAYVFSAKVHQGQTRRSGEPYLTHPLEVAHILAQLHLDAPSIATGLLHDTVEDTLVTVDQVRDLSERLHASAHYGGYKLAVLLPADVLQRVGALDERLFMYHEDLELGWRLWLAGERVLLAPASVVYHRYEFTRSVKNYYYMERNRYLVLLSHYRLGTLLLLLPALAAVGLAMIAISIGRGYWREEIGAHLYFLRPSAWASILRRRRVVQRLRRVPDRAVVRLFTSVVDFQELPDSALVKVGNAVLSWYWGVVRMLIWW